MGTKRHLAIFGLLAATTSVLPALAAPTLGGSASEVAPPPVQAAARGPQGPSLGTRAERDVYAAREAASPEAKKYKGGDVIVISTTVIVIALLIVIIIILI